MRRTVIARAARAAALVLFVGLLGTLAFAAANIDLTDFDDDVMRSMDDTLKSLDSDLATRNAREAQAHAQLIHDGLHWAEEYFTRKGNVEAAVQLAKQGEQLATDVAKSVAASDFDTALTNYDSLVKTCRRCHDAYKPPEL